MQFVNKDMTNNMMWYNVKQVRIKYNHDPANVSEYNKAYSWARYGLLAINIASDEEQIGTWSTKYN